MEETGKNRKVIIASVAAVIVAAVIVAAVVASPKKNATTTTTSNTATSPSSGSSSSSGATTANATFKDGTYTATGSYESPGGNENITIEVTLNNGIITATSATSGAGDPEASQYQAMFIEGYKSQVVGKKITEVQLSRVSGSSLTSQGFNDAISQIENQAQA